MKIVLPVWFVDWLWEHVENLERRHRKWPPHRCKTVRIPGAITVQSAE